MPDGRDDAIEPAEASTVAAAMRALGIEPESGSRVLACLSGGADSTFLAAALREAGYAVTAFHLDHALRNGSEVDASTAESTAKALGMEIVVRRERPEVAPGSSPETAARALRYAVAERVADEVGATWIATGHNADDQIETFFINLARGAGLDGLAGIPPRRGRIVRPMLSVSRRAAREACLLRGLTFVDDPTNAERTMLRNRIRMDLVPQLAEVLGAGFHESMVRQFGYLRGDAALLNAMADAKLRDAREIASGQAIALATDAVVDAPPALARRMIRRALVRIGLETPPAGRFVEEAVAVAAGGGAADLGGGFIARREGAELVVRPALIEAPASALGELPGRIEAPGFGIALVGEIVAAPERWEESTDSVWMSESSAGEYVVRVPFTGERCSPLGLGGTRPLADVLADAGLGRTERETAAVLARADEEVGRIVWPIGHRVDSSVAVPIGAPRAMLVRVERSGATPD